MPEVLLALCTFPDAEMARKVVREIVEARLAACGNIVSPVESIYRWQGKIESGSETLVFFKLTAERFPQFEEKLRSLHSYDVPEIISFDVTQGSTSYLNWVAENC